MRLTINNITDCLYGQFLLAHCFTRWTLHFLCGQCNSTIHQFLLQQKNLMKFVLLRNPFLFVSLQTFGTRSVAPSSRDGTHILEIIKPHVVAVHRWTRVVGRCVPNVQSPLIVTWPKHEPVYLQSPRDSDRWVVWIETGPVFDPTTALQWLYVYYFTLHWST